ncbi:hypothetical protein [Streptomyces sp. NPDC051452]
MTTAERLRHGQKAAIAAAGRRVAVVDRADTLGGVCLHTGTAR